MKNFYKPNIVLSGCLEHLHSRYDGKMINNDFIKKLSFHVNFIIICPEIEIGLPTPRQALRLIRNDQNEERLVFSKTGEDITDKMVSFSISFLDNISKEEIDGFIVKSHSPTCGYNDSKIYKAHGKAPIIPQKTSGLFTKTIMEKYPDTTIESDGRLTNFNIREQFLTRIFTNSYFRKIKEERSMEALIKFHSENKYLLMAYSPYDLKTLGKIVANHERKSIDEILNKYHYYLNKALSKELKRNRNVNMLEHLFGYFKKEISKNEKNYFLEVLDDYINKKVPFSVPLTIINSWVVRFKNEYLSKQRIFEPFPKDLIEVTDSGKGL
ncbi:YbgA family protein [Caldisalinibacter kiritimatiensis]|uniref:DUF1722 domain-containing protein n=1 Tax=Caldisalinibacter kiritimatiensis TaxID=1304284 RepID=R1CRE0_9FIRM|nr:DUF1722 domain-containing protein [Caldisalinibacter kiritimatiensis]EOC99278.1 hypothetical protein L21TH_2742 [Caldisalinibacter kiritimatiensis]